MGDALIEPGINVGFSESYPDALFLDERDLAFFEEPVNRDPMTAQRKGELSDGQESIHALGALQLPPFFLTRS